MALKIISGGQTGVDRAALDVALKHGIQCGGWVPAGRLDESGRIPDHYPLKELPEGSFAERTLANVRDSDGTVIIHAGDVAGGTEFTMQCCVKEKRPHCSIDATQFSVDQAAQVILDFARKEKISVLNVAGPRQSEWPAGYDYSFRALEIFVLLVKSAESG
jgi:Circularly permutated YpsA SLOG family